MQWLSAQRMEGLLCRWALALQEYSFTIVYRRGALNANADSLSRCSHKNITAASAATFCSIGIPPQTLRAAQQMIQLPVLYLIIYQGHPRNLQTQNGVSNLFIVMSNYGPNYSLLMTLCVAVIVHT